MYEENAVRLNLKEAALDASMRYELVGRCLPFWTSGRSLPIPRTGWERQEVECARCNESRYPSHLDYIPELGVGLLRRYLHMYLGRPSTMQSGVTNTRSAN